MTILQDLVQFIVSMFATLSFAILFFAPKEQYLYCSITGAVGWITYYLLTKHAVSIGMAAMIATFVLTLLSRQLSVIRKVPATIYLMTGIFPLVPGAGIYYTAYYLITNDMSMASTKGVETFLIAGAIVLGIIFGFAVPQQMFYKVKPGNPAKTINKQERNR
ncbi:MAG: threonine/serine exporter family protein [Velocimicrobium sp.]